MSKSDVETFEGKIVYNLDGSAYIIDADHANGSGLEYIQNVEASTSISVTKLSISGQEKKKGYQNIQSYKQTKDEPDQIDEVSDLGRKLLAGSGGTYRSSPKIHSFRVVSAQDANSNCPRQAFKIEKPILMCFICKLSFGNVKTFGLHANTDHRLNLKELEQQLLNREYSSAIIQRNMDEKPQISFLQPLDISSSDETEKLQLSREDRKGLLSVSPQSEFPNDSEPEKKETQTNEKDNECRSEMYSNMDQLHESDLQPKLDGSSGCMVAPSAKIPISSPKVGVKTSAKLGSLNSETAKTNLLIVSLTNSPAPSLISATGEVSLHSTDNISNNKSPKYTHEMELSSPAGLEIKCPLFGGSISPSSHLNELDATSSEFLQQSIGTPTSTTFPSQISSFHSSLAALAAKESNGNRVKLLTEFIQQQVQHQKQSLLFTSICPDHPDTKGIDCKSCELLEVNQFSISSPSSHQHIAQSLPQHQVQIQTPQIPNRSPGSNSGGLPNSPSTSSANSVGNASNTTSCFTIGACSEHINGRPQGVDCARCEMLLNSARLNSSVQMSTRNSCKTLKCPQCNWHYKYQETLEIHMREKHPDGESACGYCLAGQQHPRLARGESYSCGYKPYRCEICNYSTTTKGNLSIHMQSDKHLNNMQELNSSQNMVAAAAAASATGKFMLTSTTSQSTGTVTSSTSGSGSASTHCGSISSGASSNIGSTVSINPNVAGPGLINPGVNVGSSVNSKPKPSFRCDICSYETSVARNLRIHMTSEKHTHNMAVLQNNIKHIQALNFLQQQNTSGNTSGSNSGNSFLPEVALADLAYNQALMIQLLHQQQNQQTSNPKPSPGSSPVSTPEPFSFSPKLIKMGLGFGTAMNMGLGIPIGTNHANEVAIDSTSDFNSLTKPEMWPSAYYSCLICECFSTNNLEDLNQHLLVDRTRHSSSASSDIMVIHNNNYICRLCNYKTNLKANFQLHSKTDKHLQKLNFINHIREGGPRNEIKLQYQQHVANVVQIKCNCCDFHTNSIQKLSLHTQQMRHETMRMIFQHLLYVAQQSQMLKDSFEPGADVRQCPSPNEDHPPLQETEKLLLCQLCNFSAKNLHAMIQHVKGIRHMQVEQFMCFQRRSENQEIPGLSEVFKVTEWTRNTEDNNFEAGLDLARTATNESIVAVSPVASGSATTPTTTADGSFFGPPSPSISDDKGKSQNANIYGIDSSVSVPTTVFKCNICEYFVQSKTDMAAHIETLHPSADNDDFISIPTNTAALQAFQTAVAAAAIAVVQQQCNSINQGPLVSDQEINRNKCPERFEEDDDKISNIENNKTLDNFTAQTIPSAAENLSPQPNTLYAAQCPLCLENRFCEKTSLESHLTNIHSVTKDGLSRLLLLVDQTAWPKSSETVPAGARSLTGMTTSDNTNVLENIKINSETIISKPTGIKCLSCQHCEANFKHEEQLLQHAQQNQHFSLQNGEYSCLAANHISRPCQMRFRILSSMISHYQDSHISLVISERHVYKYRCKQCSLAFKTQEKLTGHMLYHTMRDATKCSVCQRSFRSTQALQKHMEQAHSVDVIARSPRPLTPNTDEIDKHSSGEAINIEKECKSADIAGPSLSPLQSESQISKESTPLQSSPSTLETKSQQQHFATLTSLLKQQQFINSESIGLHPETLPLSTVELSQHLQGLQNLQHMQSQLGDATTASGLPINPVDMINLMQFHHLMSLNFMNLAPPLVFGGISAGNNATSAQNSNMTSSSNSMGMTELQNPIPSNALIGDSVNINPMPTRTQTQQVNSQLASNQKRARTRITDDQLKILRAHFDINNSPSEESIVEMSQKSNLPMKVVKHWFRNTLFKERQRNKDSPYNFNNPPSTTLNLEEYERTGHAKVTNLSDIGTPTLITKTLTMSSAFTEHNTANTNEKNASSENSSNIPTSLPVLLTENLTPLSRPGSANSSGNISDFLSNNLILGQQGGKVQELLCPEETQIKPEQQDCGINSVEFTFNNKQQKQNLVKQQLQIDHSDKSTPNSEMDSHTSHSLQQTFETKSESGSSDVISRPPTPNSVAAGNIYGNVNDLMNQHLDNLGSNMGPPKKLQIAGKTFEKMSTPVLPSTSCQQYDNSPSSSSSSSGGKRANRTRFTDYQIKVLQEFFENNSYPKDSDLEYLSKLLLLSPRVIVVWFQNARQKQRKIYENQPNNSLFDNEESKKQNINYACKKCSLVFQRYYELIRHQKNHCFKEENNKKSAKAQIAAAQIAQNLSSEDSNSSLDVHHVGIFQSGSTAIQQPATTGTSTIGTQSFSASPSPQNVFAKSTSLTDFSPSTTPTPPQRERSNSLDHTNRSAKYECEKCESQFNHLEQLREHQLMHLMNPATLFASTVHSSSIESQFGQFGSILQSLHHAAAKNQTQPESPPTKRRKYSDSSSNAEDNSLINEREDRNKKFEFLHKYFMQHESNSELKQQFLTQSQHPSHLQPQEQGHELDLQLEFLTNFYQKMELKKVSNYDFLLEYYRKQEESNLKMKPKQQEHSFSSSQKPSIEFLLQYYKLNESKKFFHLVASPRAISEGVGSTQSMQIPKLTTDEPLTVISNFILEQESVEDQQLTEKSFKKNTYMMKDKDETNNIFLTTSDLNDGIKNVLIGNTENVTLKEPSNEGNNNIQSNTQYLNNLEEFLDATMIENHSQTLTFLENEDESKKDETSISVAPKTNEMEKQSSDSPINVSSKQNKRLRTTILPEQLNFLYECYQSESNPSRKMLEEISKKVNLKKRVVQVWFQNSRAKDKKTRNQRHYAHISDDNSYDGSSGKEVANDLKSNYASKKLDSDRNLQDCELCQVTQVNIQKHAFSDEHICKMKKLFKQTTELYSNSNGSGSDDNDSDREKRFYNLSKAFLLQHVVSNATSIASTHISGTGADTKRLHEDNIMLNCDTTTCNKGSTVQVESENEKNVAGNQDLIQQLFNRNHITVIGGK
ncbi:zinc finger protein 2 isoform X3 [Drosophila bipectinata]|nr:zinc finger protein 2 isoform X1 [Drosophila bipectinata]XP_043069528.1 zinc finger protein 2 isoform X1 [Drosophila bipectinata]